MKIVLPLLAGCILLVACNSADKKSADTTAAESGTTQNSMDSTKLTSIQWLDSAHQDKGKIKEGQVMDISWRFKNTGNQPLIITNASASCGCTVAEKPEQPIAPGEEGVIKAKFDSHNREGEQRKQVFVTANTKDNANQELSFQVVVEKP